MRPKKRILILGIAEHRAGCLRIVLETRGYAVDFASSPEQMVEVGGSASAFLIFGMGAEAGEALENRLWQSHPWRGCVLIKGRSLEASKISMAELLEDLRQASCRKRGPKPGCAYVRAVRSALNTAHTRKEAVA